MPDIKQSITRYKKELSFFFLAFTLSWILMISFLGADNNKDPLSKPSPSQIIEPTEMPRKVMQIVKDDNPRDLDTFGLKSSILKYKKIYVEVGYSGGCAEHEFTLSIPTQIITLGGPITLHLAHNANGDMCEAYITENLVFDLGDVGFNDFVIESFGAKTHIKVSNEPEKVQIEDLFDNLIKYEGNFISTSGMLKITTSCTRMACMGDQTTCNACNSELFLRNTTDPEKLSIQGIECADHNSSITQVELPRCKDIDIFENVRYLLKGTIKQEFNSNLDSLEFIFEVSEYKMDLDRLN